MTRLEEQLKHHPKILWQIKKARSEQHHTSQLPRSIEAIDRSFTWSVTPQGWEYWYRIHSGHLPPPENVWIDDFGISHNKEEAHD